MTFAVHHDFFVDAGCKMDSAIQMLQQFQGVELGQDYQGAGIADRVDALFH